MYLVAAPIVTITCVHLHPSYWNKAIIVAVTVAISILTLRIKSCHHSFKQRVHKKGLMQSGAEQRTDLHYSIGK